MEQRFVLYDMLGWCRVVPQCTECGDTLTWPQYQFMLRELQVMLCSDCLISDVEEKVARSYAAVR